MAFCRGKAHKSKWFHKANGSFVGGSWSNAVRGFDDLNGISGCNFFLSENTVICHEFFAILVLEETQFLKDTEQAYTKPRSKISTGKNQLQHGNQRCLTSLRCLVFVGYMQV